MNFKLYRTLLAALFVVSFAGTIMAENQAKEKDTSTEVKTRTVTSSMEHAVGAGTAVHAAPRPGPFSIGKGQIAYDFRYSFQDPKQKVNIKHKGPGNIYSVTKRKYVTTASPDPNFTLGEGKYKFFVGGMPGASGSMSFKIKDVSQKEETKEQKKLAKKADRVIETVTWVTERVKHKTEATYYVRGNKVTGIIDQKNTKVDHPSLTIEGFHYMGTFTGTINGNVITGIWKCKILPHKVIVHGHEGKKIGRKDWSSTTTNSVTTLKKDGTLTETCKVTGTSNWQWGANAHKTLTGKTESHNYTTSIPGEHVKQPIQGTWKERIKQ